MTTKDVPARIGDLPAIGRPANSALLAQGVTTLDQVAGLSEADLRALHGVGPKAVRLLREALVGRGLALRGDGAPGVAPGSSAAPASALAPAPDPGETPGASTDRAADVAALLSELEELADPRILAVNQRHGDDHAVNLTKLRAVAKRLKTDHPLAVALWATGNTAARLLALLTARPKEFAAADLDAMLRDARTPKVRDWLVGYVVTRSPHAEDLRVAWHADPDPAVQAAGWALTAGRVAKKPEGLDLPGLLEEIETRMATAPDRLQWQMNTCLAQIGIEHPEHRERALAIGERLGVLRDYPTPPNCTSPFAPIWIAEIVRRREGA